MDEILEKIIQTTMHGDGSSDQDDILLFAAVLASRGTRFLELGVAFGSSTLPLLAATARNGGLLTSVDIEDTVFRPPEDLKKYWKFVKSDAIAFLTSLPPDQKFDVIYIDDYHSYPHVKKELQLLEEHLTPTSILLLHDLMWPRCAPRYHTINRPMKSDLDSQFASGGPYRAVAELSSSWEWATFPWLNGLTLLRKKQKLWKETRLTHFVKQALKKYAPDLLRRYAKL